MFENQINFEREKVLKRKYYGPYRYNGIMAPLNISIIRWLILVTIYGIICLVFRCYIMTLIC